MPPRWRITNRFKPGFCEKHDCDVITQMLASKVERISNIHWFYLKKRAMRIKQYFAAINNPRVVYHLSKNALMKISILTKSLEFSRDEMYTLFNIKASTKQKLIKMSKKVYDTYLNH
jgi:hypothetical protein